MIGFLPRWRWSLRRGMAIAGPETAVEARTPWVAPIPPPVTQAELCPCGEPMGRSVSLHFCSPACQQVWVKRAAYGDADWDKHVADKAAKRAAAAKDADRLKGAA